MFSIILHTLALSSLALTNAQTTRNIPTNYVAAVKEANRDRQRSIQVTEGKRKSLIIKIKINLWIVTDYPVMYDRIPTKKL